jgi:hypothetical protein
VEIQCHLVPFIQFLFGQKKPDTTETLILGYNGNNYAFDFVNGNKIYYANNSGVMWNYIFNTDWNHYEIF